MERVKYFFSTLCYMIQIAFTLNPKCIHLKVHCENLSSFSIPVKHT